MSKPEVSCASCTVQGRLPTTGQIVNMSKPMTFIGQFPVRGHNTFSYHCTGCNGKAFMQPRRDPRTGRGVYVPVKLTGAESEYQPSFVNPSEAMKISVATTLTPGGGNAPMRHHVTGQQLNLPQSGVRLDPQIGQGTMITGDHPMHPDNIRKRLQPVSLSEFGQ